VELLRVPPEDPALGVDQRVHALELTETDRGLHVRHAVLPAGLADPEVALVAETPDVARALVELIVIGQQHPALAGDDQLGALEAEAAGIAEAAGPPSGGLGADRRRRVLDDSQVVLAGDPADLIHLGSMAVEVYRHHGPRAIGDCGFE